MFFIIAYSIKCRICGTGELSDNGDYFAGPCTDESDLGNHEEPCPWKENNYCLKLKITLDPILKRKVQLMEETVSNEETLKILPKQTQDTLRRNLAKRECNNTLNDVFL